MKNAATTFTKICDVLEKVIKIILVIMVAYMTGITIFEVFRRYLFGLTYRWSEETVRFVLIWTTFLGGSIGYRHGSLVSMDLVTSKLQSKTSGVILGTVVNLIVLAASVYLLYMGIKIVGAPSTTNFRAPGSRMPMVIPYSAIPVGFALICIFAVEKLFHIPDALAAVKSKEN